MNGSGIYSLDDLIHSIVFLPGITLDQKKTDSYLKSLETRYHNQLHCNDTESKVKATANTDLPIEVSVSQYYLLTVHSVKPM